LPPSASEPLGAYIRSKDYQSLKVEAGHIGLFVGGKTGKTVPAAIVSWLKERREK
jgi:polyhydroxyalkanoate synthase